MIVNERLQALVYGSVLALIIGWVLYIGKDVLVPIVLGMLVVYVIVGFARLICRVPYWGHFLPLQIGYALSVLIVALVLGVNAYVMVVNLNRAVPLAPQYQASLLSVIQTFAVYLGIADEPTWATLRQSFLEHVSILKLIRSALSSALSIVTSAIVVFLYVGFLLFEQRAFSAKIANISSEPHNVARVRQIIVSVNARIGSYLALRTALAFLVGLISWVSMVFLGVEFAMFWAMLIALLSYVPYIGSFLGVFFPVVFSILQFGELNTVIAVFLSLSVIQFLVGNLLGPYLMANSLNLSPFVILVSLTIWSGLWGIPGAFLAVPITAAMAIVFSEFAGTRPLAVLLSRDGRLSSRGG